MAAIALINGDFTILEADCWTKTMDTLVEQCLKPADEDFKLKFVPDHNITELNENGYYKTPEKEKEYYRNETEKKNPGLLEFVNKKVTEMNEEYESDEIETVSDNISNLNDKVDAIIKRMVFY